jgi:CRISPR-associated protein Csx10
MSEPLRFSLSVTMLSDWAIGSGTGRQGSLDSLVIRDGDGLPYVPASTLRGMWRDAVETLAYGLDNGTNGGWSALVLQMFGSQPAINNGDHNMRLEGPVASRLFIGDARYPDGLGKWLNGTHKTRAREAFVFVKPGVAIDPETGSAKTDFLRFDETARAGATLRANISLLCSGDAAADTAMLGLALASLALLERLGGDRRRGLGQCKVEVAEFAAAPKGMPSTVKAAVEWLQANTQAPAMVAAKTATSGSIDRKPVKSTAFRRFALDVKILSPTTIAKDVQGNVVSTLHSIPGSQLMQAAVQFAERLGLTQAAIEAAIAHGDLRILPATPALPDGARSVPAPLVLEAEKEAKDTHRNKLTDAEPEKQHKGLRGTFCGVEADGGLVKAGGLRTKLYTHNSVEDELQKPTEKAGGGVFVLEAIEPGEHLKSELWIRTGDAIADAKVDAARKSPVRVAVGRAKAAGSGQVEIYLGNELGAVTADKKDASTVIWAVSDIVLPAGDLRLEEAVKAVLKDAGLKEITIDEKSEIRAARREGWISLWALLRQTLHVVEAGSVIVLKTALNDEDLKKLAENGLGDRRSEGFGHVLVNPALLEKPGKELTGVTVEENNDTLPSTAQIEASFVKLAGAEHIRAIENMAVTTLLEALAERAVVTSENRKEIFGWHDKKPVMSQLGNLRAALAAADSTAAVRAYRARAEKSGQADKWGGGFETTLDLIQNGGDAVWGALKIDNTELAKCLITSTPENIRKRPDITANAARMLFHAGMRAHKRGSEKAEG